MSDTNTPLWKQLLGAVAGAATAFVLYQGVMFTADHLEAIVALPSTLGVTQQEQVSVAVSSSSAESVAAVASSSSSDSSRAQSGLFGWMKGAMAFFGGSSGSGTQLAAALQGEDSSSSESTGYLAQATSSSDSSFSWPVWPGTMSSSSSLAAMPMWSSSSAEAMPVWSSSSVMAASSSSVIDPFGIISSSVASSSSSRSRSSPPPVAIPAVAEPVAPSVPFVASVQARSGSLPQSGVGITVVAFTALGAVVGKWRAKKRA